METNQVVFSGDEIKQYNTLIEDRVLLCEGKSYKFKIYDAKGTSGSPHAHYEVTLKFTDAVDNEYYKEPKDDALYTHIIEGEKIVDRSASPSKSLSPTSFP